MAADIPGTNCHGVSPGNFHAIEMLSTRKVFHHRNFHKANCGCEEVITRSCSPYDMSPRTVFMIQVQKVVQMHKQQIPGSGTILGTILARFWCFHRSPLVSFRIARALKDLELACCGVTSLLLIRICSSDQGRAHRLVSLHRASSYYQGDG